MISKSVMVFFDEISHKYLGKYKYYHFIQITATYVVCFALDSDRF